MSLDKQTDRHTHTTFPCAISTLHWHIWDHMTPLSGEWADILVTVTAHKPLDTNAQWRVDGKVEVTLIDTLIAATVPKHYHLLTFSRN